MNNRTSYSFHSSIFLAIKQRNTRIVNLSIAPMQLRAICTMSITFQLEAASYWRIHPGWRWFVLFLLVLVWGWYRCLPTRPPRMGLSHHSIKWLISPKIARLKLSWPAVIIIGRSSSTCHVPISRNHFLARVTSLNSVGSTLKILETSTKMDLRQGIRMFCFYNTLQDLPVSLKE